MYYPSRKGTKDTEGDWEIIRAQVLTPTTGPRVRLFTQRMGLPLWFQWARMALPQASGVGPKPWAAWAGPLQRAKGAGCPTEQWGVMLPPPWAWRAEYPGRSDYSWALRSSGISPFCVLGLLVTHHPFLPSSFSLLECDHLSYGCPTIIFWKCITCLISQVLSWREILPQNEWYLESHTQFRCLI